MATYKVPQDVEADDKLLGPFSFRQFVYLIIVAASIGIAWILAQIFIGLIIIPMPFIIFFGALALPLKKDQPMETYLAAIFSFYFIKPRKRIWVPDGIESLVEITAPRQVEPERVKDINQHEAAARLSYLTDIIDSRGWSVRGAGVPTKVLISIRIQAEHQICLTIHKPNPKDLVNYLSNQIRKKFKLLTNKFNSNTTHPYHNNLIILSLQLIPYYSKKPATNLCRIFSSQIQPFSR